FRLGESFRKEARPGAVDRDAKVRDAEAAYRACLQYPTDYLYWARYHLALFAFERGEVDNAVEALRQNVEDYRGRQGEGKERSRFALVHISYGRQDHQTVVRLVEEVLEKLPTTPEASRARYELADAYRLLADEQR